MWELTCDLVVQVVNLKSRRTLGSKETMPPLISKKILYLGNQDGAHPIDSTHPIESRGLVDFPLTIAWSRSGALSSPDRCDDSTMGTFGAALGARWWVSFDPMESL